MLLITAVSGSAGYCAYGLLAIMVCNRSMGPLGAYILSAKVVGVLYDREVANYHSRFPNRQWNLDDINTCYGQRCFGFSLVFLALVCLVGTVVDVILALRTTGFYQRLQASFTHANH